jgi:hypothetical protein
MVVRSSTKHRQMRYCLTFSLALVAVVNTGCVTHYSVTKVTPGSNPKGLRVHLPAPFIIGRPSPDGTVKYNVELLPDPDQEYAIDAWTIMAKQKAEIGRTIEMYVQKMTLAQDTTAVASQLASSAASVGKSAVDSLITQRQAQTTAVTAKEADVAAKTIALEKAQAEVASAKDALNAAEASGDATAIKSARATLAAKELAVTEAQIDLKAAHEALAKARNFDQPTSKDKTGLDTGGKVTAPGPAIYRIVENPKTGGIKLEPVNFKLFSFNGKPVEGTQLQFETWGKKPANDTKPDTGAASPIPKIQVPVEITIDKYSGNLTYIVKFDSDVKQGLDAQTTVKDGQDNDQKKFLTKIEASGTNAVKLTWDKDTPNNKYALTLWVLFKDNRAAPYPLTVTVK